MAQREGVVESLRLRETNAGHPAEPAFLQRQALPETAPDHSFHEGVISPWRVKWLFLETPSGRCG